MGQNSAMDFITPCSVKYMHMYAYWAMLFHVVLTAVHNHKTFYVLGKKMSP